MDQSEILRAIQAGLKPLRPRPKLRLSRWAEKNFYLSRESSYVEQAWKAYPFQVGIMDCISDDDIAEVDVRKSARVGFTKILVAGTQFFAQHQRRNQVVYQPTDDDSDEFVKVEIDPALRDSPIMAEVFPEYLRRDKRNTLRQKSFLGSVLHTRGAKAAKNFRRLTVDTVWFDELDAADTDVEKEGNPRKLALKRLEGATFPKAVFGSTPKLKHISMIDAAMSEAAICLRFYIPCPLCEVKIPLTWGGKGKAHGFKWTEGDPETVRHLCPHCGGLFSQAQYFEVWHDGVWMFGDGGWLDLSGSANPVFRSATGEAIATPRSVGFDVWTAYSPQATWPAIVREFQGAMEKVQTGDYSSLKTFVNLTLGESWEQPGERIDENELSKRADDRARGELAAGTLILVASVDVQADRFECSIWGCGRGEETWLIDHLIIDANPAVIDDWAKLDEIRAMRFAHPGGQMLGIEAMAVDTGGHWTHQAYMFCRNRRFNKVYAVKGEQRPARPIKSHASLVDISWNGQTIRSGVKLWLVGTDTAKDLLHGRYSVQMPGPGCIHFPRGLPLEYYEQLTGELRVLAKTAHGEQYRWVKRRQRNEALDCAVYALFLFHALKLDQYTEAQWLHLEAVLNPPMRGLFDTPVVSIAAVPSQEEKASVAAPRPSAPSRSTGSLASDAWGARL
jgi:terminase, large subunit